MSNTVKMTNKVALEMAIGLANKEFDRISVHNLSDDTTPSQMLDTGDLGELITKLNKMLEQNNKKNSSTVGADGKKVLSATQKVNDEIMTKIVTTLEERESQEPIQIKEFMEIDWVKENAYSNQKMSALFKKLVDNGTLERVVEKRVTKFKLV